MNSVGLTVSGVVCWGGVALVLGGLTPTPAGRRRLTLANAVTALRGALAAGLFGFVLVDPPTGPSAAAWAPALCVAAAGGLDVVDGWLARRRDATSALGDRLDVEADGVLVLSSTVLAVAWHRAPAWVLLVGAARYAYLLAVQVRAYRDRPVGTPTSRLRNRLAYAAMVGALAVGLVPAVGPGVARPLVATVAAGFLANFGYDWVTRTRGATAPAADPPSPRRGPGAER